MYILSNFRQSNTDGYTLIGETRRIDLTPGVLSVKPFGARGNDNDHTSYTENAVNSFREICQYYDQKGELVNVSDFDVAGSADPFTESEEEAEETEPEPEPSEEAEPPKRTRTRRATKPKPEESAGDSETE